MNFFYLAPGQGAGARPLNKMLPWIDFSGPPITPRLWDSSGELYRHRDLVRANPAHDRRATSGRTRPQIR